MPDNTTNPEQFPSPRDRAFGDIVVEMGLARRDLVDAVLALQVRYANAGHEVPSLPRLLVARKIISQSQAERALARLGGQATGDPSMAPDQIYADTSKTLPAIEEDDADEPSAAPRIILPAQGGAEGEGQEPGAASGAPPPAAPGGAGLPQVPRITYPTDTGTVEIIMPTASMGDDTTIRAEEAPPRPAASPPAPAPAPAPGAGAGAGAGAAKPGEPIKGYKILGRLSQDETGSIFRARQVAMDRLVALKVLPPKMTADRAFIERFLAEARNAGQLNHPNLTRVHEVGRSGNYYFYSMELVEGRSLEENIKLGGRMESPRAVQVTLEVCRAIEHMAAKGLVHGDLWPRTVMLLSEGGIKLAMASLGGARSPDRLLVGGRHHYAAPETTGRGRPDIRADIYSAGGVLYYALTGQHPFSGVEPRSVLSPAYAGPVPDPRTVLPNVFTTVATVVCHAMARDPDQRYRTPAEMIAALETAAAALKPRATSTVHRPPTRPVTRPATRMGGTPATRHTRIRRRRR